MVTALYPGSFDPVTEGHTDVAARASALFDKVVVAVYASPSKNLLFDTDERVELFKDAVTHLPNVEVRQFQGLVVRFAQDIGAAVIVRGLRSGSDFEYEYEMAFMNRKLAPDVDMVSFMTSQEHMYVSSSLLKEVARLGGDITGMVTPKVATAVYEKFGIRPRNWRPRRKGDIIDIINTIDRLDILINNSKAMPITGSLMMDKAKLIELVDQLRLCIPQEVRAAEEVLYQKEQIMNVAMADARRAKARAEDEFSKQLTDSEQQRRAEQILEDAQERASRILQMAEAEAESRRTEADAYALRTLRSLEREINGISGSVRKGIDMLAGSTLAGAAMANNNGNADVL